MISPLAVSGIAAGIAGEHVGGGFFGGLLGGEVAGVELGVFFLQLFDEFTALGGGDGGGDFGGGEGEELAFLELDAFPGRVADDGVEAGLACGGGCFIFEGRCLFCGRFVPTPQRGWALGGVGGEFGLKYFGEGDIPTHGQVGWTLMSSTREFPQ